MSRSNVVTPMHGWCPPPPACPPPVPPGDCGCGCDQPPFGAWGSQLRDCWKQIEALKCIIKEIMDEMGGPIKTGPIQGVVDGSQALAGDVGERVKGSAIMAYAAYPALTTGNLSPLVLQPGDWDIWAYMSFTSEFGGGVFQLSPAPTGISNPLLTVFGGGVSVGQLGEITIMTSTIACLSCSVPTLLAFAVSVQQGTDDTLPAGTATLTVEARRVR